MDQSTYPTDGQDPPPQFPHGALPGNIPHPSSIPLGMAHDANFRRVLEELHSHGPPDFKHHELPLARIKKIMKSDEDVSMISAEAPVIFSKACELFILDITMRSWINTTDNKRRTLQRSDVAAAIADCDMFDFLLDICPTESLKLGNTRPAATMDIPVADISLPDSQFNDSPPTPAPHAVPRQSTTSQPESTPVFTETRKPDSPMPFYEAPDGDQMMQVPVADEVWFSPTSSSVSKE